MRTLTLNTEPKANNVIDVRSITAYSHYLMMKAQLAGNLRFDGHKVSEEELEVARQCCELCDKISRRLGICKEAEIPDLLECYDIAYRVGHRRLPDSKFIDTYKRRVLKAWKTDDRDIEESSIFSMIASEVAYNPGKADPEYLKAYLSLKNKWVETLLKHNRFSDVTTNENYRRLALIMRENIDGYLTEDEYSEDVKRGWYDYNRVEDLSTLSSTLLRSYRNFVNSLPSVVIDHDEKQALDNRILGELSTRPDLALHDRQAFRMTLEFNREMAMG